ncbi:MAG: hypothetical protein JNL28_01245 [Planctomycetes bacterium]|nr:hypothetical protein [Planctomycetota bacterium]
MSIRLPVLVCTTVLALGLNAAAQSGPPSNDDCSTPIVLPGPGLYPYDTNAATTGAEGQVTTSSGCGSTPLVQDLWFTYTPTRTGSLTITTCGQFAGPSYQTSKMRIYSGAGCPSSGAAVLCHTNVCSGSDGSYVIYGFTCWEPITIQLGNYVNHPTLAASGYLLVHESGLLCSTQTTKFCASDPLGATCVACGNNGGVGRGCANSSFVQGAQLSSYGAASTVADTLVLSAYDITGPGLFFQANALFSSPASFGDGMLCANAGLIRLGIVIPTGFQASYPSGSGSVPIHLSGGPLSPGDTKHYQCWYRDSVVFCTAATFNMTQGLTLTWGP